MSQVFHDGLVLAIVISSSMALAGALIWSCIVRLNDEPWLRRSFSADQDGSDLT
ncbi:MAG: hypothetical protein V3T83_20955 [Acidobacteriota bacterium]